MIERSQHEGILTFRLAHGKVSAIDVELLDALLRELPGVASSRTDRGRAGGPGR